MLDDIISEKTFESAFSNRHRLMTSSISLVNFEGEEENGPFPVQPELLPILKFRASRGLKKTLLWTDSTYEGKSRNLPSNKAKLNNKFETLEQCRYLHGENVDSIVTMFKKSLDYEFGSMENLTF
ncbi:hypothetical protein CEXT_533511 [Caerostris extrusa]|uniref:Uncharacterized protein n=1 Tax=Caerostris extrusa TaxID=172846 RepID=A0AAV4M3P8_CAEEX|nr:hypothetical protein CEXT_533511 [Caerostris extrusa]